MSRALAKEVEAMNKKKKNKKKKKNRKKIKCENND